LACREQRSITLFALRRCDSAARCTRSSLRRALLLRRKRRAAARRRQVLGDLAQPTRTLWCGGLAMTVSATTAGAVTVSCVALRFACSRSRATFFACFGGIIT